MASFGASCASSKNSVPPQNTFSISVRVWPNAPQHKRNSASKRGRTGTKDALAADARQGVVLLLGDFEKGRVLYGPTVKPRREP